MKCAQHECLHDATCSYEWLGKIYAACPRHGLWAKKIAVTLGMDLRLQPIEVAEREAGERVLAHILKER